MKTIGLLILISVVNVVCAQINNNIIDINKTWQNIETCNWGAEPTIKKYFIKLSSDTLINANNYKIVNYSENIEFDSSKSVGYIRESNNKIYFMDKNTMNEGLIYDFDLSIGNSVMIVNNFLNSSDKTLTIENIDTIEINDQKIRKFKFQNTDEYWLEGIGSIYGLLNAGFSDTTGCYYDLTCFKEESFVYTNPKYSDCQFLTNIIAPINPYVDKRCSISPNPIGNESVLEIENINQSKYNINIYSYCGLKIKSDFFYGNEYIIYGNNFNRGIYLFSITGDNNVILNGKFIK